MSRITHLIAGATSYIRAHKLLSIIVALVLLGGGYYAYQKFFASTVETKYVLGTVSRGTIVASVSESGQVSSSNEITLNPKASGEITAVYVKDGQQVAKGQAIAQIDTTDAYQSLKDAQANLKSAQLSLAKLQEPEDDLTLAQAQNKLDQATQTIATDNTTNFNDVADAFLDLPSIITGLNTIDFGTTASHGTQWNIDYFMAQASQYTSSPSEAKAYRDNAYNAYNAAKASYDKAFADYQAASRGADASTTATLLQETYETTRLIANAVKLSNSLIQYYQDKLTSLNYSPIAESNTDLNSLNSYTGKVNSHLTQLLSDINNLQNHQAAVTEARLNLEKLKSGPDDLDVQTSQLTIEQRQNAVSQAQSNLADYTIRAPFSGTLANFSLRVGDTVGTGTSVATLIGRENIAELSLNEVDAAKVKVGDKATLTFDAIEDLSIAGQVVSVSPVGTASQGVVSYTVKVAFDTDDDRVKSGMTVNAAIITDTAQNVLTVPSSAVKTSNGVSRVQVVENAPSDASTSGVTLETTPKQVEVTTGLSDDTSIEILSGLTEGQTIVTKTITSSTSANTTTSSSRSSNTRSMGGPGMMGL